VVTHADYVERRLAEAPSAARLTIVAARADRPRQIYADVEVVHADGHQQDIALDDPRILPDNRYSCADAKSASSQ